MRLSAASAILQSRVGRKLFATFFVLVAVPVGAVSLLAYQLTAYIVHHSAAQMGSEVAKAAGISVIDRMRAGESLLQMYARQREAGAPVHAALDERLGRVFAGVDVSPAPLPSGEAQAGGLSSVQFAPGGQPGQPPAVDLLVRRDGVAVRGRFKPDYLWESAQSGTHHICFAASGLAQPFCQGMQPVGAHPTRTERDIFLLPYFDAPAIKVTTAHEPAVGRYLPIGVAALVGNVAGIAFLLAVISSSVLLRKLTRPLDALTFGTRAVLGGDFTRRVRIEGPRSEFTDLADSFNAMTEEVGRDLQLFQLLARIDRAIVEQRPFDEVVHLVLGHIDPRSCGGQVCVVQWYTGAAQPRALCLAGDGTLAQHATTAPAEAVPEAELKVQVQSQGSCAGCADTGWADFPVAQTPAQRVWLRVAQAPVAPGRAERELAAFCQRLAVAAHAEHHEQQLRERATRDSLTGLRNRFGLVEAIDQLIGEEQAAQTPRPFAVVYMDLDGFKEINDAYGHDVGDRVLKEVAARLCDCLGERALSVARPGGDEFVFVLRSGPPADVHKVAQAVLAAVRVPLRVPPRLLQLGASLGMARFPEHGATHDDLLKHADLAMYSAKNSGRNVLVEFDYALDAEQGERLALRQDLREALAARQMYVVFQPRVGGRDRRIASAEALLRWRHPAKGLVPPDLFIAMAEETGFILDLGRWVLRQALEQFVRWRADPQVPIRHISVNLSPVQLADPAFPGELQALVQELGIRPGELELEITEGALIQDVDAAVDRLAALRAQGVAIALDDFGVGYSAMRYLNRLPFDTLKIDKSFVSAFGNDRPALAIATAIVALAQALDKRVVAEGVETQIQADILEGLGVDELQGYLYGKPQTAAELEAAHWPGVPGHHSPV